MTVPALARARHLLCGVASKAQPGVWKGDTLAESQPKWLNWTAPGALPVFHRMLWSLDDLLFNGWTLWDVERDEADGPITGKAERIGAHRWSFTTEATILVDDKPFPSKRALLIPGPHEGVLAFARGPISQAKELEDSATRVAQNPAAYLALTYSGETPLTPEQRLSYRVEWAEARRGEYGGVAWLGRNMDVKELGAAAEHLLVEGRNAAAVNMARIASMPAAMVDATNAGASLTYETTNGRNAEFLDYGADLYLDAIAARLSMDDCVAPGESTRFDTAQLRSLAPSPTGPVTED